MITQRQATKYHIPEHRRRYLNDISHDTLDEDPNRFWKTLLYALILLLLFLWIASCNNANHMKKVYPKGYYSRGVYKANHKFPKGDNLTTVK